MQARHVVHDFQQTKFDFTRAQVAYWGSSTRNSANDRASQMQNNKNLRTRWLTPRKCEDSLPRTRLNIVNCRRTLILTKQWPGYKTKCET